MINNQNLAVLSEKVAHLESAVKNSDEASEISYDNTESGLTADDVQAAIDEVQGEIDDLSTNKIDKSKVIETTLVYSTETSRFEYVSATAPRPAIGTQVCVVGRNRSSGAIYALWFNSSADAWLIGGTINGAAPSNNDEVLIQYTVK